MEMTIEKLLNEFYSKNGIPKDGGVDDSTFEFKAFGLKLILPNPKFRRKAVYIHDIQHVLHNCDTSWKGESFIAGWEISTGMWRYFLLSFLSLWAMGYGLWQYPKSVFLGFKKGLNNKGIIDLPVSKSELMKMEYSELIKIIKKERVTKMEGMQWAEFMGWVLLSQLVFLFPLLVIGLGLTLLLM